MLQPLQLVKSALLAFLLVLGMSTLTAQAQSAASQSPQTLAAIASQEDGLHTENPYGLKALWLQSDLVAKATLLILAVMSIGSWYVIVTKFIEQRSVITYAKEVVDSGFWQNKNQEKASEALSDKSPYRHIAQMGMRSAHRHADLQGHVDFSSWIASNINRAASSVQSRLQDGLALLATVSSTAPFVGLFGTVWGIYNALVKIGLSGQASIDKVAGPVGESLIMTAIGLAVAVPAVLGYNWLVRRNKAVMGGLHAFGQDLHAVLISTTRS